MTALLTDIHFKDTVSANNSKTKAMAFITRSVRLEVISAPPANVPTKEAAPPMAISAKKSVPNMIPS